MQHCMKYMIGTLAAACALAVSGTACKVAAADEPGLTATEITLGGTHPYSGPASAYGVIGKGVAAYFAYINDKGGVNGRKIKYIDKDDSYSPPQTVQLTRQLVEENNVFAMFDGVGTAPQTAVRPYLNAKGVPQLFVASGATTWGRDYKQFPWTVGYNLDYEAESIIYAQDLLKRSPSAKIGVLYQNDDYGQDYLAGLNKGLGAKKNLIVKTASYETSEPSVTSQVSSLRASGADTFFIFATPKFSAQALIAAAQQSWHPTIYLNNVSALAPVMNGATKAGGVDATKGVISLSYGKDPNDPQWANDSGMKLYRAIVAKYAPGADPTDQALAYGVGVAYTMVDALQKAGRDLTRQKLLDAALHLDESNGPLSLPGIPLRTSPNFRFPFTAGKLQVYSDGRFHLQANAIDVRPFIQEAEQH